MAILTDTVYVVPIDTIRSNDTLYIKTKLMNKQERDSAFRCSVCGKYVSYNDIMKGKVILDFTPDSEYTEEEIIMTHKKCKEE